MMIVIEGPARVGKTTQSKLLLDAMRESGVTCSMATDPFSMARDSIATLSKSEKEYSAPTWLMAVCASRVLNVEYAKISRGVNIFDQFWYSQMITPLIDPEHNKMLCELSSLGVDPDIKILLLPETETSESKLYEATLHPEDWYRVYRGNIRDNHATILSVVLDKIGDSR